jgi:DNA polymerase III delta prime subunit
MNTIKDLLTERLRPKNFEHLILPQRVRAALGNGGFIQQNILLYGQPGTGKTSAAKVIASKQPFVYINVSDESSVDIIRTKITDFCSTISLMGATDGAHTEKGYPVKVVILDEIDGASDQFFKALRGTVEKFASSCRFIATCNFINKVPEAVQSRFELVNFDFVNKDEEREVMDLWKANIKNILQRLDIEITPKALDEFISRNFPDMRSALNRIQSFQIQGVKLLTEETIRELSWSFEDVYAMLVKEPDAYANYEFIVSNYSSQVEDIMEAIGSDFIHWLKEKHPSKAKHIPQIIVTVASHQAQRNVVIDPVVSLLSLCFTVQKYVNQP